MVWGEECRLGASGNTCHAGILWWCQYCMHLCVTWQCHGQTTLLTFLLWGQLSACKHSELLMFQYNGKVTRITPFWSKMTVAVIFPAVSALIEFLLSQTCHAASFYWWPCGFCIHDFSCWQCTLIISSSLEMCGTIQSIAAQILVENSGSRFHPSW